MNEETRPAQPERPLKTTAQVLVDCLEADRLHIPVVNTMMAKGIIPMDDKYSLWTIGIPQKDYVNQVFDRADMVIAIGYDIVECAPAKWGAR